ncbi:membrane protein [Clostridium acetobutylicum EA 2018]|uniref:Predicted membrane protein n=1 Tax=Clostridium acetobutylicum (strain ATCC 824 / DSM 792 / JCM 1419 / IAM 19013 / LMG 5710 / NBRC 13948 / NRRL B-527 / VKM B-1787 / 2291 / W) TaxID=272562 RepID=Q97GS3_CLOAB|nr:Predicted membrane protein [Clostridium acetobutylicum ATCC 824]ADZ21345.1 membrane protein [Clostridium acetobutylicum EA 2018]AEI32268.1 hypothetical protein SMB_G2326 [Clostridium acetobutylicum DSM 1731]AWV79327.1 hypothetical protein DK921_04290 [Clostridium acetobutylicum]PSM07287.1 hypothetical protein C7T89_04290 [Clostridium sp. NJ4]
MYYLHMKSKQIYHIILIYKLNNIFQSLYHICNPSIFHLIVIGSLIQIITIKNNKIQYLTFILISCILYLY